MEPDQIDTMDIDELRRELRKMLVAPHRIAKCVDAPDINVTGEWQFGLHCGVEDRDCQNSYEGAEYGHTIGVEKALEWATNEVKGALSNTRGVNSEPVGN